MSKFIIHSEYGELLDLAIHLKNEGHDVLMHIPEKDYKKVGEGMVEKVDELYSLIGNGYIWVVDGCAHGKLQDLLRKKGEAVFGSSEMGDELENNRQAGQKWFKRAGFTQPFSKNFQSIDDAIKFIEEHTDKRWILKQNGEAPKSLNYMSKFNGNEDMLYHLAELKKSWNESEYGPVDFDLMEVVEGLEMGATAFFNGENYMENKEGKVIGFLDFEEKKECDGNTGETTGEMGTTFMGVTESNQLFKEILMKPKIIEVLRKSGFRGVFNINCIKTKNGIVALEATCRPGVPATSYELIEGLESKTADLIEAVAKGINSKIEVRQGVGMVMVIAARPYPIEINLDDSATSLGEKLWILENGKPIKDFTKDQKKHIHLRNFYKSIDGETKGESYLVATKNGYLFTVTGIGNDISETRENLIKYIKDNVYISGMKYRHDIGERVEEHAGKEDTIKIKEKELDTEKENLKMKQDKLEMIKNQVKKLLYG